MCNQLPETIEVLDARKSGFVIDMTHKIIQAFLIDHAIRYLKKVKFQGR